MDHVNNCIYFPRNITILSDGSVTTCCVDVFGKNLFDSVYKETLLNIWNNKIKKAVLAGPEQLNMCKKCFHYKDARRSNDKVQFKNYEFPEILQVEIMATCNYGCCISKDLYKYREVKPDLNLIFQNIKSFLPKIRQIDLFNNGEPLLHDGFCDFVRKCRKVSESLYLNLFTNGSLMDPKMSKFLIDQKVNCVVVSVHGAPGTENMLKYSLYGANYEKVLDNVRILLAFKKKLNVGLPAVHLKAVLFDWNEDDRSMNQFRKDARSLGLKATGGRGDCYYWTPDHYQGGPKRFAIGSKAFDELVRRGEIN